MWCLSHGNAYPCSATHDLSQTACPESCSAASWVFAHIAVWGCEDVFGCSPAHRLASAWWQSRKWYWPGLPGSSLFHTQKHNKSFFFFTSQTTPWPESKKKLTINLLKQCSLLMTHIEGSYFVKDYSRLIAYCIFMDRFSKWCSISGTIYLCI